MKDVNKIVGKYSIWHASSLFEEGSKGSRLMTGKKD